MPRINERSGILSASYVPRCLCGTLLFKNAADECVSAFLIGCYYGQN